MKIVLELYNPTHLNPYWYFRVYQDEVLVAVGSHDEFLKACVMAEKAMEL